MRETYIGVEFLAFITKLVEVCRAVYKEHIEMLILTLELHLCVRVGEIDRTNIIILPDWFVRLGQFGV